MKFNELPFHLGPSSTPHNPNGLPDVWPFSCGVNLKKGVLFQYSNHELIELLRKAYSGGELFFGTPLADDSCGKPYADDFLSFIDSSVKGDYGSALEIGAGVGYVLRRLIDAGWKAVGVEPGTGYAYYWKRYNVDVINDYFPSSSTNGPYDLICSYGVLEHMADPFDFLEDVYERLSPSGEVVISVPDCTDEILAGDPSILLHEHFTYFNAETLESMLWDAGFNATVQKSGYGRCLYAIAQIREGVSGQPYRKDLHLLKSYPERAQHFIKCVRKKISELQSSGTVGIYCPARALGVLDPGIPMRFFDDDENLQGKYLPPFNIPIESREALTVNPVTTVVIMSRTFGERIRSSLNDTGYSGQILTMSDIFCM